MAFKFFSKTKGEVKENLDMLKSRLEDHQRNFVKMDTDRPEKLRKFYNLLINNLDLREDDDMQRLTEITEIQTKIDECKQVISEIKNITDGIRVKLSTPKVATFQALALESIAKHKIKPKTFEQIIVLSQPYDEKNTPFYKGHGNHTKKHRNKAKKTKSKNRRKY
jgi:hypothetical protein